MNRKALATAVAAVFAAPAALAQSALTISGNVNIIYDYAKAGGNTGGDVPGGTNNSLKGHDRVPDGTLSNIRFTVTEDLGGGASAFVQVECAVIQNSDTRSNAAGAGAVTGGWGNRNSGVGLMSKAAGRFVVGVWDLHYHELYPIEPGREITNAAAGVLGLMQNFGSGFQRLALHRHALQQHHPLGFACVERLQRQRRKPRARLRAFATSSRHAAIACRTRSSG